MNITSCYQILSMWEKEWGRGVCSHLSYSWWYSMWFWRSRCSPIEGTVGTNIQTLGPKLRTRSSRCNLSVPPKLSSYVVKYRVHKQGSQSCRAHGNGKKTSELRDNTISAEFHWRWKTLRRWMCPHTSAAYQRVDQQSPGFLKQILEEHEGNTVG